MRKCFENLKRNSTLFIFPTYMLEWVTETGQYYVYSLPKIYFIYDLMMFTWYGRRTLIFPSSKIISQIWHILNINLSWEFLYKIQPCLHFIFLIFSCNDKDPLYCRQSVSKKSKHVTSNSNEYCLIWAFVNNPKCFEMETFFVCVHRSERF